MAQRRKSRPRAHPFLWVELLRATRELFWGRARERLWLMSPTPPPTRRVGQEVGPETILVLGKPS